MLLVQYGAVGTIWYAFHVEIFSSFYFLTFFHGITQNRAIWVDPSETGSFCSVQTGLDRYGLVPVLNQQTDLVLQCSVQYAPNQVFRVSFVVLGCI